jgi:uncharacterized protein YcfJ
MGYGLLQAGMESRDQAMNAMSQVAQMDKQRTATNDAMKQQKKAGMVSGTATGAMAGAMMGAQAGGVTGPVGALIGGGIGLLASSLL